MSLLGFRGMHSPLPVWILGDGDEENLPLLFKQLVLLPGAMHVVLSPATDHNVPHRDLELFVCKTES